MRRYRFNGNLGYLNAVALLIACIIYFSIKAMPPNTVNTPNSGSLTKVERVIDGDTFKISNGDRVRLIGIDTPESRMNSKLMRDVKRTKKDADTIISLGKKAAAFTRSLISGKSVRIEYDVKRRDRHGRILAYVYLEDGTFLNAKLVSEGYAQVYTVPPNVKYAGEFKRLQEEARVAGRGLWSK